MIASRHTMFKSILQYILFIHLSNKEPEYPYRWPAAPTPFFTIQKYSFVRLNLLNKRTGRRCILLSNCILLGIMYMLNFCHERNFHILHTCVPMRFLRIAYTFHLFFSSFISPNACVHDLHMNPVESQHIWHSLFQLPLKAL